MKKSVVFALVCVLLMGLLAVTATAESYDIIYLTPSTASTFWSQVEVGILQAKADLERDWASPSTTPSSAPPKSRRPRSTSRPSKTPSRRTPTRS